MGDQKVRELLEYELFGSWWAAWLSAEWSQNLAARWFIWKIHRKLRRQQRLKDAAKITTYAREQRARQEYWRKAANK